MLPEFRAELIQLIVSIALALLSGGVGAALVSWLANRGKTAAEASLADAQANKARAEAESERITSSIKLLDEYQEDRARLIVRVDDLEGDCRKLKSTVEFLVAQNNELQRDKVRQDTVIATYINAQDKLKAEIVEIRAELARYKRIVTNLFKWIRKQGLEPPTVEELECE